MSDLEDVKSALQELLDQGGKNGRSWFFPRNVDNRYKLIANLTLGEIVQYFLPAFLMIIGLCFIPPYNSVWLWIVKFLLIIIILLIPMVYVMYRPVKERDNIRTKDFIREQMVYRQKQKVYYKKPKIKPWKG